MTEFDLLDEMIIQRDQARAERDKAEKQRDELCEAIKGMMKDPSCDWCDNPLSFEELIELVNKIEGRG